MLMTDQVATAPCTDCIQVRFLLLRQSRVPTIDVVDVGGRAFDKVDVNAIPFTFGKTSGRLAR